MAVDTGGVQDTDNARSLETALNAVFDRHDDVLVAALGPDGYRVEVPASVDHPGQRTIPLADRRATMVDVAVPADRLVVVGIWEQALSSGIGFGSIRTMIDPDRRMSLTIVDATARHGVWLALLTDDGTAVGSRPDVLPEMLVVPSRPRQATLYKTMTAVITGIEPDITGMLGWGEKDMVGKRSTEFIHEDDQERAIENWMDMMSTKQSQRVRFRHRCLDGTWLWLEVENICHDAENPDDIVVEARFSDIADEMAAHEALRYREQLFSRLAESLPNGVVQVERDGTVVFANQRLLSVLDTAASDLTLDGLLASVVDEDRPVVRGALDRAFDAGLDAEFEVTVSRVGIVRRFLVSIVAVTSLEGRPTALVNVSDVTESAQLREDLRVRATYDMLTGCHNRGSVMAALDAALAAGNGDDTAVIFIDLVKFKPINDRLGHAAGDQLLVQVAERLQEVSRSGDLVGRLGGDEFVLVCRDLVDAPKQVQIIADRIQFALHHPMMLSAATIEIGASIGVACSRPGMTSDALVSLADQAMYLSKHRGTGPVLHQS